MKLPEINKYFRLISLFIVFLIISLPAKPQSGYASKKEAAIIKATMLIVIIDDSTSAYNTAIKNAIEKYWKFSTFRFVPESEKDNYCKGGYTILDKHHIDVFSSEMFYIAVLLPDRKIQKWENKDMKAYSYASFDTEKINGEIIRSVQFIQNYLNLVLIKGGDNSGLYRVCHLCNEEKSTVKDNLLLLNNSDVEKGLDDSGKIARHYKHPFKLAGRIEICHEMEEQKSKVAYLFYFVDTRGHLYRLVVQAKDSKIIYCQKDLQEQFLLFNKQDLKALSR